MISVSVRAIAEDALVMIYRKGMKLTASLLSSENASGSSSRSRCRAEPTPYHPVRKNRAWLQLNTHGMARRSPKERLPVLRAGLDPILLDSMTSMGVACEKN